MRAVSPALRRLVPLLAVVALVATACGAATPALSDPKEILTKAIEAAQNAKSFHVVATLDGQLNVDLTGSGGGSMALTGTKIEGDIDLAGKKVKATFLVPAMFGLSGEVIVVDTTSYIKTSLTGDKYMKSEAGSDLPVTPGDPDQTLADIKAWLDKPEVAPAKGDDADCSGKKCYVVTIELTGAELATLSGDSPLGSMDPNSTVTMTFKVEKNPVRLAEVAIAASLGAQGSLTLGLTLSNWDASVSVEAPPDDQVTEGSGFPGL